MNQYIEASKGDFDKVIEYFKKDISNLRTGRANPSMLDGIQVEAYGVKNPLSGIASTTISDARTLVVAPWDKNVLKEIEKAIVEADLGYGVVNEGDKIRIVVPIMTEENRRNLVKKLNEKMEQSRISIRQVREDIKESIESAEKDKDINEDDKFRFLKELDEEVSRQNEEIKAIREKKENEIMAI